MALKDYCLITIAVIYIHANLQLYFIFASLREPEPRYPTIPWGKGEAREGCLLFVYQKNGEKSHVTALMPHDLLQTNSFLHFLTPETLSTPLPRTSLLECRKETPSVMKARALRTLWNTVQIDLYHWLNSNYSPREHCQPVPGMLCLLAICL